ncbi:MAG: hypothetical protein ABJG42_12720 [Vibrio splendidus]
MNKSIPKLRWYECWSGMDDEIEFVPESDSKQCLEGDVGLAE